MVSDPPGLPIIFEEVTCQVSIPFLKCGHTLYACIESQGGTVLDMSRCMHAWEPWVMGCGPLKYKPALHARVLTSPNLPPHKKNTKPTTKTQESPCIMAQMAKTNPGFAAQVVQAYNDQARAFDA